MIKRIDTPFDDIPPGDETIIPDTSPFFPEETEFLPDEYFTDYQPEENEVETDIITQCCDFFSGNGPLKNADFGSRKAEERPQQLAMATAIAEALVNGENLCIEAPTGVGKSFAYLVPLIYRSKYCRRPSVISTETITLQEQLIEKDLPKLAELTGIQFKAALAKGRRNYLCRRRFELLSGDQRDALLPNPSMLLDVERLNRVLAKGGDGTRDGLGFSLDGNVWNLVCCESGNCLGAKCPFYRNCYYYKARREWEEADIIVANHALFFTDLAMHGALENAETEGSLLPNYGAVMIDEAHTLENNAAEYLGLHISRAGLVGMLNRLYNPDSAKGLLMRPGTGVLELRAAAAAARDEAYGFFTPYENYLIERKETAAIINHPENFPDCLSPALMTLARHLEQKLEDEEDESFSKELSSNLDRCREYIDGLDQFNHQTLKDAVYYAESERNSVTLHAAPLNVAEILSELLFNNDFPVMLCSATLTVRNSFNYFTGRTGFHGGKTLKLDSPFSPEQATIYISEKMPDPASSEFIPALVEEIPRYVELTDGKAFVLFTSHHALRSCADALKVPFLIKGWKLLVQGGDLTRNQMLNEFRDDVDSVLFGTDSFWTGVDVPGEALSNVILTRLPFASPGHPLIAARMQRIEAQGKSSFSEYSLPEAVLKFRQGAGRLIRSRTDRGVIVLLDRRVITKSYGRMFLESLPYKVIRE